MSKNYKLNSGERQIGTSINSIRRDHLVRYQTAIDNIKELDQCRFGLDAFTGNGYGTVTKNVTF